MNMLDVSILKKMSNIFGRIFNLPLDFLKNYWYNVYGYIYTFEDLLDIDINRIFHALKELSDLNSEQRKIILEFLRIIMKVSDVRNANITF